MSFSGIHRGSCGKKCEISKFILKVAGGSQCAWGGRPLLTSDPQGVRAPYFLTDGSLLFLVRECGVGDSDIDINIDQVYWGRLG